MYLDNKANNQTSDRQASDDPTVEITQEQLAQSDAKCFAASKPETMNPMHHCWKRRKDSTSFTNFHLLSHYGEFL